MFFRWDWLRPVLTAPIVPTLGPVHPDVLTVERFEDVLAIAHEGEHRFLPYDKDRRWFERKDETVLPDDIVHLPDHTLIPTLSHRGRGSVKVYAYGHHQGTIAQAQDLASKLAALYGTNGARVLRTFSPAERPAYGTRVYLQDFTHRTCSAPDGPVRPLDTWPHQVQETFESFADAMASHGFAFLRQQMQTGRHGPVLTALLGKTIVGAIGPMEIAPDAASAAQLLPQYFAVLPEARGHGFGRLLWRAAMHWGKTHGAAYQLLQTEINGPSDRLCESEGLTPLGSALVTSAVRRTIRPAG
jgi:GNAT superfamily N-acetyltransferase